MPGPAEYARRPFPSATSILHEEGNGFQPIPESNCSKVAEATVSANRSADDRNPTLLLDATYFALRGVAMAKQKAGTVPAAE